eukprot:CFRG0379T1
MNILSELPLYAQLLGGYVSCIIIATAINYIRRPGFDVDGKHVLITGGSEGLGLAFARKCLKLGANVSIVSRSLDKLAIAEKQLASDIRDHRKLYSYSCDVTNHEDVVKMIEICNKEQGGPADTVVLSAGMATPGLFLQQDISIFSKLMNVNYFGALNVAHACMPPMIDAGVNGRVVFVSSSAALTPFVGYTQYCASKTALKGLADALRTEAAAYGISVSIMYPSSIDTPGFQEENKTKPAPTQEIESLASLSSAEEVAECLLEGLRNGNYQITNEFFGEISRALMNGINPRNSTLVEFLCFPLFYVVGVVFSQYIDHVTRCHLCDGKSKKED